MFLDATDIDDGATLECDVCIVGAGAAGLTIAHELAGSGLSVIMIAGVVDAMSASCRSEWLCKCCSAPWK